MDTEKHSSVLILDFGSQYTQLIARRIREMGVFSYVLPGDASIDEMKRIHPQLVVLSGGPSSVYSEDAPKLVKGFFEYQEEKNFPLLGICYGMQLLVENLGGRVTSSDRREYGRTTIEIDHKSEFFSSSLPKSLNVWMSHGDHVEELPTGFKSIAQSRSGTFAAIENREKKFVALQFHPEVTHTEYGFEILKHFILETCALSADWTMKSVLEEEIQKIQTQVGDSQHVICALSGGVDSAVAATLVHRAIGDRLHCVFVDHGLLRYEEQSRVMKLFKEQLHLPVKCVDASDIFLSKLKGVEDPEQKRKIIGTEFIRCFERFAKDLKKEIGHDAEFLVQGTLYPDVIESSPPPSQGGSGKKHSTTIKSHHNVGGLPKDLKFKLIEPLRDLFKDEVRELGQVMDVPRDFLKRHPFPGPGLAVRIIGEVVKRDLDTLRHADEIFIQELHTAGLYDEIWQAFAVFLPIKSVGVQGDGRTHDNVVALRAVTSRDGMTADWYPLPFETLSRTSNRICNEVRGVNRVVYDVSSKPPATIEWE